MCSGCGECSVAAKQVETWCNSSGVDMAVDDSPCRSATDCVGCCEMNHPEGSAAFRMRPKSCLCSNPGDCSFECSGSDWCDGRRASILCVPCMQTEISTGGSCLRSVATCTASSPDCTGLVACIKSCR